MERNLLRFMPVKRVDYDQYFIQIRESTPLILFIAGILLIIFAGFCMIGGLVIGILAEQIFTNVTN